MPRTRSLTLLKSPCSDCEIPSMHHGHPEAPKQNGIVSEKCARPAECAIAEHACADASLPAAAARIAHAAFFGVNSPLPLSVTQDPAVSSELSTMAFWCEGVCWGCVKHCGTEPN